MLLIVCGLQGTGKTTVAKKVAEKIGASLVRTDVLRKELIEKPKYSEEEKQKIYDEMFSKTQKLLSASKKVVLDATFEKKENRIWAEKLAKEASVDFKIIEIVCSESTIKKRIRERFGDASQADFSIYSKYKETFEPINEEHITIDNSGSLSDTDKQIDKYFGESTGDSMKRRDLKLVPRYLSIVALASLTIGIVMIFIVTNLAIWFFLATVVLWAVAKYFHKKNKVSEDKSESKPD